MSGTASERLAGQVIVAGFEGPRAPAALLEQARDGLLGGFILFRRNVADALGAAQLIGPLASAFPAEAPPLVGIDQEGGRVQRLREGVLQLPPMRQLGALDDPDLCRRVGRVLGAQLAAVGVTLDFAPVLDVDTRPDNPVIGDRAFANTPEGVIRLGLAFADGLREGGVGACAKHFPGHGDTTLDSHLALPKLDHDRARLDTVELAPFREARGRVDAIMSAHVVFESLAPGVPATHAPEVITGLLRQTLGFDGLVVSDDLEMRAVADLCPIGESACRAVAAGCVTLLICSRLDWAQQARQALAERAERNAAFARRLEDAAERSLSFRKAHVPKLPQDLDVLRAHLDSAESRALREELARRLA